MKRSLLLLSLSLLVACTQPTVIAPPLGSGETTPGTGTPIGGGVGSGSGTPGTGPDDVPSVLRAKRPSAPDCNAVGLAQQLSGGNLAELRYLNFSSGLKAQMSASTLLGLLFDTRKAINTRYYGYSTVDLQALHDTWETQVRAALGNLNGPITSAADTLMDSYVAGVSDEHTYYLNAAQYKSFTDQSGGAATPTPRFGFSFGPVPGEDGAVLTDVGDGTPADAAGLRRGDTLLSVNGQALSGPASGAQARYSALLGQAAQSGTAVTFQVRRAEQLNTVKVTPKIISSASLPWGYLEGSTAILRIPTFNTAGVAQDVHNLVHQAQKQGATGIILDLRDNGGGFVSEATGVSAAFAPNLAGQTLEFIDANDVTFAYQNGTVRVSAICNGLLGSLIIQQPALWTGKLAVLVNASSASASEVVTTTLQRSGATALGENTVGVGNTAINLVELPGKRGMGITVARSRALGGSGEYLKASVSPDISVLDDLKQLAHGRDLPLEQALAKVK
jgi:carboxyl-terminal processing protease